MISIRHFIRKYLLNNLSIKDIFRKNYIRFQEYKFFKFKKKLKYFEEGYFKLTPFISEKELIDYNYFLLYFFKLNKKSLNVFKNYLIKNLRISILNSF